MAANRATVERALDKADPAIRCYLLYGPDESGSRALAARLAKALGEGAERIDLEPGALKSDPARLADEAAALSMFGGARHIRVEGAGDECLAAVEALLEAPAAGNPVVLIAGALRKDAKLVKRVDGDPAGMAFASYPPEARDTAQLAVATGRELGLRIDPDTARLLAEAAGGDRAILAQELEKLALYADAAPDRPREATPAMIEAIGADAGEADLTRVIDAVFSGDAAMLDRELARAAAEGQEGIPILRAAMRRLLAMAPIRAEIERGASPRTAMERAGRALFWKDRDAVARDIVRWPANKIATALDRLAAAERLLKTSNGPGNVAADAELFTLVRAARR